METFAGYALTEQVIAAGIEVHRRLGPGLLESTYEHCLCRELDLRGIAYRRQLPIPIEYRGTTLDCGYRIDLLVDDRVVIELKSLDQILPVHVAQLLTYLKLSHYPVGLLMNFNVVALKYGLRRVTIRDSDLSIS
jgi:GxxExxY protein